MKLEFIALGAWIPVPFIFAWMGYIPPPTWIWLALVTGLALGQQIPR